MNSTGFANPRPDTTQRQTPPNNVALGNWWATDEGGVRGLRTHVRGRSPFHCVHVYGDSRDQALAKVLSLAFTVLADEVEHGERNAKTLLSVTVATREAA